jgi:hypothetical protein
VAQSVELLNDFGVTIQHIPLTKKTWQLTMLIEEDVGGVAILKALKHYCERLLEAYGEPTYAGSNRYKGEAFERFSKLDMQILTGEN